jgi:uroporphyrinogen decarboxylase
MDIYDVFKSYHGKISFLGGLSIQNTLPFGSLEEVRGASYKLLEELGGKGGYIFSPSHALTNDIPPENIREVINIARNQSKGLYEMG